MDVGILPPGPLQRLRPCRVVVLRALPGLGDQLCCVPALRALRRALPEARVTFITAPESMSLLGRYPHLVDDLLEFPGFPGLPEVAVDVRRIATFLSEQQDVGYDLALQLHGSGAYTNQFAVLLGAAHTAGFYLPVQFCPEPALFVEYDSEVHEIHRLLAVVEHLGAAADGDHLEFPLLADDARRLRELLAGRMQKAAYAVLHPGAKDPRRRWPTERFVAVGRRLAEAGLRVVVTGGSGERQANRDLIAALDAVGVDLTGQTDLGTLAALLAGARLVVSNDTGVSHLAAAMRTPSVVVFSASDPRRWAPLDRRRHRIVAPPQATFEPLVHCLRDACLKAPWNGSTSVRHVSTEDVVREVGLALDGAGG